MLAITSKKTAFGSYIEIPFTSLVHVRVEMLFRLPIELRLKVYELVFGTCPCRNPHAFYTPKHQIASNILLINRQIYAETRVLGFQLHKFDFHRWCGTGVHSCKIFLQRLCQWQLCSIQRLSLRAVESSLINGSGSCLPASEWIDICAILGAAVGPNCTGLRELSLTMEGQLIEGGLRLLDTEAEWVKIGLGSFKCLQRLELIIASDTIHIGAATNFKCGLADTLRGVRIVMKAVVCGREISL
jgi:hypothetical protein